MHLVSSALHKQFDVRPSTTLTGFDEYHTNRISPITFTKLRVMKHFYG